MFAPGSVSRVSESVIVPTILPEADAGSEPEEAGAQVISARIRDRSSDLEGIVVYAFPLSFPFSAVQDSISHRL
jgi:hypothetical protein